MSSSENRGFKYDKYSESKAVSYILHEHVSFEWQIKNFSLYVAAVNEKIKSPSFKSSDATWELWLFPDVQKNDTNKLWVSLIKQSSVKNDHKVTFTIALRGGKDAVVQSHLYTDTFDKDGHGFSLAMIDRSELLGSKRESLLPDDILTVYCDMTIERDIIHGGTICVTAEQQKYAKSPASIECLEGLSKEFATLYGDKKSCDVTMKAGEKEFPAHSVILGARSSVFRAMFQHDMQEKRSSVVDISDMSASVLEAMLWYIYSGKLSIVNLEKAAGLFIAADKYALAELKTECSRYMIANLSVNNFCNIAGLASSPGDEELMDVVKRFFRENTSCILQMRKWQELVRESPRITSTLLEALVFPLFVNENNRTVKDDEIIKK